MLARIRQRWDEERRNYTLIVVAEGAFPKGSDTSYIKPAAAGTVARLGGAGLQLEQQLEAAFAAGWDRHRKVPEVRTTVLGHLQRGGSPGAYDRIVSLRFGLGAVELASEGRWNRMVTLQGTQIRSVELLEAIAKPHVADPDGQLVQQVRQLGICVGD